MAGVPDGLWAHVFLVNRDPMFDLAPLAAGQPLRDIMNNTATTIQVRGRSSNFLEVQGVHGDWTEAPVPLMVAVISVAGDAVGFLRALESLAAHLTAVLPPPFSFFLGEVSDSGEIAMQSLDEDVTPEILARTY